jgi:hypothetical protein
VNGAQASAIVAVSSPEGPDGEVVISPLFVSVTETMVVTDHEGIPA